MKTKLHGIAFLLLAALSAAGQNSTPGSTTPGTSNIPGSSTSNAITGGGNVSGTAAGSAVTSANEAEVFRQLDANGDGQLSKEEFSRLSTMSPQNSSGSHNNSNSSNRSSSDSQR